MRDGERLGGFAASADDYDDVEEKPVRRSVSNAAPAKPVRKPKRIWDEDDEGEAIYSDDDGKTWFYED